MATAFPDFENRKELPIDRHKYTILDHIRQQQVTCIYGATGCGKSTRVPEFILEEYSQKILYGEENVPPPNIVITQPRRIGATSLAERVSHEVGETEIGKLVGYKIGQDKKCSELTQICYVTTGYMIESLVHHPQTFDKYTHVILDEIHERDLDADLLSLVVKLLMETYHKPKLVVMSATLQLDLFLKYFVGEQDSIEWDNHVIDINVKSPFSVKVVYLEEFYRFLLQEKRITLSEDTRSMILITYCQFLRIKPMDLLLGADSDGGDHTLMSELAETLDKIPEIKLEDREVWPVDSYLSLAVTLIKATAETGGSILVFLPGVREIEELFDKLLPYEDRHQPGWNCQLLLFPLHSKVPFNDQAECFQMPEPHLCHVIMATNIAESSITLPKINVILDFGQRRNLTYDTRKRIQFLKLDWCSKASMDQRKGRTGRVCDGVCFRIMPRQFYKNQLGDYDEAQMKKAPLDKLVLQVKQVAEKISPGETPSELLAQTVEPPSLININCAVKNLAGIGAITENDENAKVTLLGRLCTSLPLDLYLCRLVMFGVLFNQPCDAVVMAAALQGQDPFRKPTKRIIKSQEKFIKSLRSSCDSRRKFDDKSFSEPIMYRNMIKEWLTVVDRKDRDAKLDIIKLRRTFCKDNDIDKKALSVIDGLILEIAQSLLKWLPQDSANRNNMEALIKLVPTKSKISQPLAGCSSKQWSHDMLIDDVEDLFCKPVLQLHMIIAASFVPRFLAGKVMSRKGYIEPEVLIQNMKEHGMDPSRSVVIADLPLELQMADDTEIKHMTQNLALRCDHVIEKHPDVNFSFAKVGDRLFVEFDKRGIPDEVPEHLKLTDDVHVGVHYMYQYSEAPSVKNNKFAYQMKGSRDASSRQKRIQLSMPQNPYKTEWILLSYDGSPLNTADILEKKECRIFGDWRNPVGFVFDTQNHPHYGVTADIRAGGGNTDKKDKQRDNARSRQNDTWSGGFGWAEGASLFPVYQENRYALLLMLAFVPDLDQVFFVVNTSDMTILKVRLYDVSIDVSQTYPLNKKLFRTVNKLRLKISKIFTDSVCQRACQLPDSEVKKMFDRLLFELMQNKTSSQDAATALLDDGQTSTNKLPKKVTVPASYRSQPVSVEEFVYLHPYDTDVLFKKQVLCEFYSKKENSDLYSSDSLDSDDLMDLLTLGFLKGFM